MSMTLDEAVVFLKDWRADMRGRWVARGIDRKFEDVFSVILEEIDRLKAELDAAHKVAGRRP